MHWQDAGDENVLLGKGSKLVLVAAFDDETIEASERITARPVPDSEA